MDPLLGLLQALPADADPALQFLIKFTGLTKKTPRERILRAVSEELADLCEEGAAALRNAPPSRGLDALGAFAKSAAAVASTSAGIEDVARCRATLDACLAEAVAGGHAAVAGPLQRVLARYAALSERLRWLLNGTAVDELRSLDPVRDADRIHHAVSSAFRVEARVLELLAINRVAQSRALSLFFRSTKEAEEHGIRRFYDTWSLLASYFEWGADSRRGREALTRMRQIHGRYFIPSDAMKYVLLDAAFTFIEGAERIGHRALLPIEKLGYFNAYVRLGRAMDIAELSNDYDAMVEWFRAWSASRAQFAPIKADTFRMFVSGSMLGFDNPSFAAWMMTAARVAMDDDYRVAVGLAAPSPEETAAVRAVFFTLGQTLAMLPRGPFVRSLHNNPSRSTYTDPGQLGVSERSPHVPGPRAGDRNRGQPEGQRPLARPPDAPAVELPLLEWTEVARHNTVESLWIVLRGEVYDVTAFALQHPGGLDRLLAVAGTDATAAFEAAAHSAATDVFRLNYRVGRVA